MPAFREELELLEQHKKIHVGIDRLEGYLVDCRVGERELRMGELREIMDGFGAVLWEHLDAEVSQLGAENMRKFWTVSVLIYVCAETDIEYRSRRCRRCPCDGRKVVLWIVLLADCCILVEQSFSLFLHLETSYRPTMNVTSMVRDSHISQFRSTSCILYVKSGFKST